MGRTWSNTIGDSAALGFRRRPASSSHKRPRRAPFWLKDVSRVLAPAPHGRVLAPCPVGEKPNTGNLVLRSQSEGAHVAIHPNFMTVQQEWGRAERRSRLYRQQKLPSHGERFLNRPGAGRRDRPGKLAADAALSAVQQTSHHQPIDAAKSRYHAGFVRVQKRFSAGFSLLANTRVTLQRMMWKVQRVLATLAVTWISTTAASMGRRAASDVPHHSSTTVPLRDSRHSPAN